MRTTVRRILATAAIGLATLVVVPTTAGADTYQPVPGGPLLPTQGFENMSVTLGECIDGKFALLDIEFQLHYPVDGITVSIRDVHLDGTTGPWFDAVNWGIYYVPTGSPVLWHWHSPLTRGRWEIRIGVFDPMTGGNLWYEHPTVLDPCPRRR